MMTPSARPWRKACCLILPPASDPSPLRHFLAGDDSRCEAVEEDMLSNYKLKEDAILAQQTRTREVRVMEGAGGGGRGRWSMCTHVHPPLALGRPQAPPSTNQECICRPK